MCSLQITLKGGSPWGFRLQGGREFDEPLRVAKINPNSKAHLGGLGVGDYVYEINGQKTEGLNHGDAQQLIKEASDLLILSLRRCDKKEDQDENASTSVQSDQSMVKQNHRVYQTSMAKPTLSTGTSYTAQLQHQGRMDQCTSGTSSTSTVQLKGSLSGPCDEQYIQDASRKSHYRMNESRSDSDTHVKFASGQKVPDHLHDVRSGSCATMPHKGLPHQSKESSVPTVSSGESCNAFVNIYSTLPNMKSHKSLLGPDLEVKMNSQPTTQSCGVSVSQLLCTNMEGTCSQGQSSQDGDNHSSSSAFTSSDSHDTVVSRDTLREENSSVSKVTHTIPTSIPIRVLHEESGHHSHWTQQLRGVWSPGFCTAKEETKKLQEENSDLGQQSKDTMFVWTPGSSPGGSQKQFRSVTVKLAPSVPAKSTSQQVVPKPVKPEESYAWQGDDSQKSSFGDTPTSSFVYTPMDSASRLSGTAMTNVTPLQWNGQSDCRTKQMNDRDDVHLPPTQSPYITLLQRGRDGHLPKGASYLGRKTSASEITGSANVDDEDVKPVRHEGIGPVTDDGLPLAFRKNLDEKNQHAWYRQMYRNLHKTNKGEGDNKYKPTYYFPDSISDTKSEDDLDIFKPVTGYSSNVKDDSGYRSEPEGKLRSSFTKIRMKNSSTDKQRTLPNVRSRIEVYRNQPRSIVHYEPGFSSIAFQEHKARIRYRQRAHSAHSALIKNKSPIHNPPIDKPGQFSRYSEGLMQPVTDLGDNDGGDKEEVREVYRQVQSGGEIPMRGLQKIVPEKPRKFRHPTSAEITHSPEKLRRRKEEEEVYRKKRLEQLQEEERHKRQIIEEADAEARRHSDVSASPKSPISADRFEEPPSKVGSLSIPIERRRGFQVQGKAKAIHTFTAQNARELSFRKGDVLYLLRHIDRNWFEGELHGRVGIFPVNYVEVITSIEAAKMAAMNAEGRGRAKYNFTAQSTVELSLRKGDFLVLLRRVDKNWLEGRIGKRQGIFPASYVDILQEPSTPLVTPAPSVITTPMTGTPEMLSPMSYEAPTPPPEPSPNASLQCLHLGIGPYGYMQCSPGLSPMEHDEQISQVLSDVLAPVATGHSDSSHSLSLGGQGFGTRKTMGHLAPLVTSPSEESSHLRPNTCGKLMETVAVPVSKDPQKADSPIKSPFSPSTTNAISSLLLSEFTEQNGHSDKNYTDVNCSIEDELIITRYRALYAYKPVNEDELELREGDEIYVMEKCDDGWYVGTSSHTGMFGTFPGNYVQPMCKYQ